jgi:hypothetical protein
VLLLAALYFIYEQYRGSLNFSAFNVTISENREGTQKFSFHKTLEQLTPERILFFIDYCAVTLMLRVIKHVQDIIVKGNLR